MKNDLSGLYEDFRKPLLRFLRYRVGDAHLAEDLLQEVFIKAGRSLDTLQDGQKVQSWLYAIASNTVNDYFRKKHPTFTDATELTDEPEIRDSVLNELECCLLDFIASLPEAQAAALRGLYFDELKLTEISEKKSVNLSTLKSHVKRGKIRMKKLFEECCEFQTDQKGQLVDFSKKLKGGKGCKQCTG